MSLWTPGGEHPVDGDADVAGPELDEDQRERAAAMAAEMDDVRRELASVPASVIVSNHLMGLYELAAIHLSDDPPAFGEAQVAIDAMGAVLEALEGRLGEHEATLRDALGQMRLAYVQLKGRASPAED